MFSATFPLVPVEAARYEASTDTGADIMDYIENNRRRQKELTPTEEQIQLKKDVKTMKKNLREPLDPSKPIPIELNGDDMLYDQRSGNFFVTGNVQITSMDKRRFTTEEMEGNLKAQRVIVTNKAHILQMTEGTFDISMDAYNTKYDFLSGEGTMENAKGKMSHQYFTAKKVELFRDLAILHNATTTKCSAKHPDYHISADRVEIFQKQDLMIMYNVKYWLGGAVVYHSKKSVRKISETSDTWFPKVGYSNDNGFWIRDTVEFPIADRVSGFGELTYYTKKKFKGVAGINWSNGHNTWKLRHGFFEDSNNRWIYKEPTLIYQYTNNIGKWPFYYVIDGEWGRWKQNSKISTHSYYKLTVGRRTLNLNGFKLNYKVGYSVTKESLNHSHVNGFSYDATVIKDFNKRFTAYVGYHYSKKNTKNSLFNYDLDDYSRKLEFGGSYAFSDHDRLAMGFNYDMSTKQLKDIDYYWFHDIHCAELIVRYRAKRKQWNVGVQFQPW